MWNKFQNNNKGFTGLEAAIVLVAFVVVAAVFSYVMLGAGFYTTQKSQEVVHTGVMQASSSVELAGNVVANASEDDEHIGSVTVFLQLTSGGSSVDINKTLIVFTAPGQKPVDFVNSSYTESENPKFYITTKHNEEDGNGLLDRFEKYEISVPLEKFEIGPNEKFQIEIKPPEGASYTVHRQAPASISDIMILV